MQLNGFICKFQNIYLSLFKWLELCYLQTESPKFGIKMKRTFTYFPLSWLCAFNLPYCCEHLTFISVQELCLLSVYYCRPFTHFCFLFVDQLPMFILMSTMMHVVFNYVLLKDILRLCNHVLCLYCNFLIMSLQFDAFVYIPNEDRKIMYHVFWLYKIIISLSFSKDDFFNKIWN